MASQSQGSTEALIARIEASRHTLGEDITSLRHRFDLPARARASFRTKPLKWLAGSLGAGLFASQLLKKPRPVVEKSPAPRRSWFASLLGGAFTLARPSLQNWATQELLKRFVIPRNDNAGKS
ncbi:MAG: hypothetical protein EAZ65_00115 [Verrucomicrobia bacterium]|nr:MAG: hypothetical protein EAZ84_10640 [Verrucomicrobiota bacterium]TAE89372.1 MAG: hypothetical protein EAZ82_01780 [Verrucomicrobiota bacterium]TAF27752.1 MAG: hypothetical protein EAZ71_00115 [Verrucomicrobiota bacterium]TAF42601.1 MAG: hypothetical protein EAZ65_00115 [Verrucomicrobiota bacterium]